MGRTQIGSYNGEPRTVRAKYSIGPLIRVEYLQFAPFDDKAPAIF